MHTTWSCRQPHRYALRRRLVLAGHPMQPREEAARAHRVPPWFRNDLTPRAEARLRQWLANCVGSHGLLERLTFGEAEAILQAAGRAPIAATDPIEWQIEVLHQLKRLVER